MISEAYLLAMDSGPTLLAKKKKESPAAAYPSTEGSKKNLSQKKKLLKLTCGFKDLQVHTHKFSVVIRGNSA
jgi:hypothetical protein